MNSTITDIDLDSTQEFLLLKVLCKALGNRCCQLPRKADKFLQGNIRHLTVTLTS